MSITPLNVIASQMSSLITLASSIENSCDTVLSNNYKGNVVNIDVDLLLKDSSIDNQDKENVVIKLVKQRYPKWTVELYTGTSLPITKYLKFTAMDFS